MKKLWIIFGIVLLIGVFMAVRSCNTPPPPSRQHEELDSVDYAPQGEWVVAAIQEFYRSPARFASRWQSRGDNYLSAVRTLKTFAAGNWKVERSYRFKSSPAKLFFELSHSGTPALIVGVWHQDRRLTLTEIDRCGEVADD